MFATPDKIVFAQVWLFLLGCCASYPFAIGNASSPNLVRIILSLPASSSCRASFTRPFPKPNKLGSRAHRMMLFSQLLTLSRKTRVVETGREKGRNTEKEDRAQMLPPKRDRPTGQPNNNAMAETLLLLSDSRSKWR